MTDRTSPTSLTPYTVEGTFKYLTTGMVNGKGLFDSLMHTVKQHLQQEFDENRIRGSEYTKVYLGSMEAVLGNTVQYLLGMSLIEEQKEKLSLEAEILRQEIKLFPLKEKQLDAQIKLTDAQIKKAEVDIRQAEEQVLLAKEQVKLAKAELEMMPLKKNQLQTETTRLQHEIERTRYEIDNILPLEKEKVDLSSKKIASDIRVTDSQVKTMEWQYQNQLPQELAKTRSEIELIDSKTASEKKQPILSDWQVQLFQKQIWGFERDAEQKVAKIYSDVFSVQKSVDDGLQPPDGMTSKEIKRAMTKLLTGLGA